MINAVQKLAESRSVSMAQIALEWVLRNPLVTAPIVGATKLDHLPEAVDALGLELSDQEVQELGDDATRRLRIQPTLRLVHGPSRRLVAGWM